MDNEIVETGWIQTSTGRQAWPLALAVEQVKIEDIAHALSNLCRFGGHVSKFYSVAEHCCHVSDLVSDEHKLEGLLHDASEAYLQDLPHPLKYLPEFEFYREAETRAEIVIATCFRLDYGAWFDTIKPADNLLVATEAYEMMLPVHPDWTLPTRPSPLIAIQHWTPGRGRGRISCSI